MVRVWRGFAVLGVSWCESLPAAFADVAQAGWISQLALRAA